MLPPQFAQGTALLLSGLVLFVIARSRHAWVATTSRTVILPRPLELILRSGRGPLVVMFLPGQIWTSLAMIVGASMMLGLWGGRQPLAVGLGIIIIGLLVDALITVVPGLTHWRRERRKQIENSSRIANGKPRDE